jgi:hypothetical protein
MEGNRKVPALSNKEKALEQLTQDFIMALSRDSVKHLAGVDMMTAYVKATGYVRSHSLPSSQTAIDAKLPCSHCGELK